MDRRTFLIGLFGTAAAALTSDIIDKVVSMSPEEAYESFMRQWYLAAMPALIDLQTNAIVYGCGALRMTEEYPYIESISPDQIYMSELERNDANDFHALGLEMLGVTL